MGQRLRQFGGQQNTEAQLERSTGQINVDEGLSIFVIIKKNSSAYECPTKAVEARFQS
jgi:hypothetical protein